MNGIGAYQAYPTYGGYGYSMPSAANGYQLPPLPGMDAYMGSMGMMGGGDMQQMMGISYGNLEQQIQMAQARLNNARLQQGRIDANNNGAVAGEINLMGLLKKGVLNREEFMAASATQNEIQRTLARFKADGQIDPQEQAHLQQMRARLNEQLREFAAGDCKPELAVDSKANQQAGVLFDLVKSGKISPKQAAELRQQMAQAQAQKGAEEGGDPNALNVENDASEMLEEIQENLETSGEKDSKDRWKLPEQQFNPNIQLAQPQGVYYGAAYGTNDPGY